MDQQTCSIRKPPVPGAWTIASEGGGTLIRSSGTGRRVASTDVSHLPPRKPDETFGAYRMRCDTEAAANRANARLIAAAPDLLGALAACVGAGGDTGGLVDLPVIIRARAALAKAQGAVVPAGADGQPLSPEDSCA